MTDGQREIARYIYNEVKAFGGKGVKVTLSDDYYVYIEVFDEENLVVAVD